MKKILIIEDDPFLSGMYLKKLKLSGLEVKVAVDGQEGLESIKKDRPDLVLLDIVLPQMDGYEILKRLKEDKELRTIPVILLTNLGQKEEVEKGMALGAEAYIIKAHFTPTAVVNKVKEVLEKKK
jgi:DNA-binding response OmpR family regulator